MVLEPATGGAAGGGIPTKAADPSTALMANRHGGACGETGGVAGAVERDDNKIYVDPSRGPGKVCPSCKSAMAAGAVLCVHCGHNLATGGS